MLDCFMNSRYNFYPVRRLNFVLWNLKMLIMGIHGVGNPSSGEIESELAWTLAGSGVTAQTTEINWNQILSFPYLEGAVDSDAVFVLARRLARLSIRSLRRFWLGTT